MEFPNGAHFFIELSSNEKEDIEKMGGAIKIFASPMFMSPEGNYDRILWNKDPPAQDDTEMNYRIQVFLKAAQLLPGSTTNFAAKMIWSFGPAFGIEYGYFLNYCNFLNVKFNFPPPPNDNDDFKLPIKTSKVVETPPPKEIPTENKFEGLAEQVTPPSVPEIMESDSVSVKVLSEPNSAKTKPLVALGVPDQVKFIKLLSGETNTKFKCKNVGNNLKIFPENSDEKFKIMEFLRIQGIDFYNIPDTPSFIKVVIKGLPPNLDLNLIKEELTLKSFEPIAVKQMISFKDKSPLPIFIIDLPKNSKSKQIFSLKELMHIIIKIEPFRPKKKIIQCFNCQSFFHRAQNCFASPRCVRCGDKHTHKECPLIKSETSVPKCCNCNSAGHPSSYRGCPNFPKIKPKVNLPPRNFSSYANAVKNKTSSVNQPQSPLNFSQNSDPELDSFVTILNEIKNELRINSFAELRYKLKTTLVNMKKLNSVEDKIFAFLDVFQK